MGQEETTVNKLAQMSLTEQGARVFRNNVGTAWVGKLTEEYPSSGGRIITLTKARRMPFGLIVPAPKSSAKSHGGSSDLIGWQTVRITPDMVGLRLAVFVAVETKTDGYPKASKEQKNFLRQVKKAGGIARIARRGDTPEGVVFEEVEE